MPDKTTVTFLGTCANRPVGGQDSASFLINGRYLVDTGWCAALRMLDYGLDPADLQYLLITHRHRDHTMGLPHIIAYRHIIRQQQPEREVPPLNVLGPAADLEELVSRTLHFLRFDQDAAMLNLLPLNPGDAFDTDAFHISTCASRHTSPGLVYRFRDKRSGAELAFTGDTQYDPEIVGHVKGVGLLIHDACYSDNDPFDKAGRHARPRDAARTAAEAGAARLALVHAADWKRDEKVASAKTIFPNTFWPADGETIEIT